MIHLNDSNLTNIIQNYFGYIPILPKDILCNLCNLNLSMQPHSSYVFRNNGDTIASCPACLHLILNSSLNGTNRWIYALVNNLAETHTF